jgi:hypothetical protein
MLEKALGTVFVEFDVAELVDDEQVDSADDGAVDSSRLEKLGFVRDGTLREDCVVNGEVSDSWVYELLRREWQPSE